MIKFHTMEQMVNLLQRAVCNDLFLFVSKDYFNACGAQPFFHNSRGLLQRCSEGSKKSSFCNRGDTYILQYHGELQTRKLYQAPNTV